MVRKEREKTMKKFMDQDFLLESEILCIIGAIWNFKDTLVIMELLMDILLMKYGSFVSLN